MELTGSEKLARLEATKVNLLVRAPGTKSTSEVLYIPSRNVEALLKALEH